MENGTTTPQTVKKPYKGTAVHKRKFLAGLAKNDALEALNATNINGTAREIYALILRHSISGKPAWPNQTRLGFESGRSVRTVQSALRRLERTKLIETVHRREIDKKFKYGRAYKVNWELLWECYLVWLRYEGDWEALAQSDQLRDLEREAESDCATRAIATCSSATATTQLTGCVAEEKERRTSPDETMFRDAAGPPEEPAEVATTDAPPPQAEQRDSSRPRRHGTNPRARGTNKRAEDAREEQERERARDALRAEHDRQALRGAEAKRGIADILNAVRSRTRAAPTDTIEGADEDHLPGLHKVSELSTLPGTAVGADP